MSEEKKILGSPQAGLGGLGETPSDAQRDAKLLLDVSDLYDGYQAALVSSPSEHRRKLRDTAWNAYQEQAVIVGASIARALLAASPSPWRSMESIRREALEEAVKCADNAEFRARGMVRGARGPKARSQALAAEAAAKQIKAAIRALKPLPAPPSEGELK